MLRGGSSSRPTPHHNTQGGKNLGKRNPAFSPMSYPTTAELRWGKTELPYYSRAAMGQDCKDERLFPPLAFPRPRLTQRRN